MSVDRWCTAPLVLPFFLEYLLNAEYSVWSVVHVLHPSSHRWSPVVLFAYGVNLNTRMLDSILYVTAKLTCVDRIVASVGVFTLLIKRYSDWLLPLLRQFLFISNSISKLMDHRMNCPASCFNQICWNYIIIWWCESC